jgi:hypothetical protein
LRACSENKALKSAFAGTPLFYLVHSTQLAIRPAFLFEAGEWGGGTWMLKLAFAGLALAALIWRAGSAAAQSITEQDKAAMTAVERVFTERFNLGTYPGVVLPFTILAPGFAKGEGRLSSLALYLVPGTDCTYQLAQATNGAKEIIAQIKFGLLSNEYKSSGRWFIFFGVNDAVCKDSRFIKNAADRESGWTCQSNYAYSYNADDDHRSQVVRAFTYIHSNLCKPHQMPID